MKKKEDRLKRRQKDWGRECKVEGKERARAQGRL